MPINSKNGETVRVTQKWNGYRPNIRYLLEDFYISLCNQRVQELKDRYRIPKKIGILKLPSGGNGNKIKWIENLLLTPLTDYRKFAIWRVLSPYLLNIRGLSQGDAYDIIRLWLEECNRICRLDFIPDHRVKLR